MASRRTPKAPKASRIRTFDELQRESDAAQLFACAVAFDRAKRPIPANILRRLWGLRSEWKRRTDAPPQLLDACRKIDAHNARGGAS